MMLVGQGDCVGSEGVVDKEHRTDYGYPSAIIEIAKGSDVGM
jgi:hypothetical protein